MATLLAKGENKLVGQALMEAEVLLHGVSKASAVEWVGRAGRLKRTVAKRGRRGAANVTGAGLIFFGDLSERGGEVVDEETRRRLAQRGEELGAGEEGGDAMGAGGGEVAGEVDHDAVILRDIEDFEEGITFGVAYETHRYTSTASASGSGMPERACRGDNFHAAEAEGDVACGEGGEEEVAAVEMMSLLVEGLGVGLEVCGLDAGGLVGGDEGLGGEGGGEEVVEVDRLGGEEEVGNPLRAA